MTCKHIDILAVALLLLGMAMYSNLRTAIPLVITQKRTAVTQRLHRPMILVPQTPRVSLFLD